MISSSHNMDILGPIGTGNRRNLDMPLIVSPPSTEAENRRLRRRAAAWKIRSLGHGLYTDDIRSPLERVSRREMLSITSAMVPDGVISHRSALEGGSVSGGALHMTGPRRQTLELPGLTIRVRRGPGPLRDDARIPTAVPGHATSRASDARAVLENLQVSRARRPQDRHVLGQAGVERWLDVFLSRHDESALNRLRDRARTIADSLGWQKQFAKLDAIIGTLLGTRKTKLRHPQAIARSQRLPIDSARVDLFLRVAEYLNAHPPIAQRAAPRPDPSLGAFIESYFSNYIEGTEFELEEAHRIVMSGQPAPTRENDSHDLIGTFNAILASVQDPQLPATREAFERQLQDWNRQVLFARLSRNPGQWKAESNRARNTHFVDRSLVRGTLAKGFELMLLAPLPEVRAALAQFVVAEVHPFQDGNGRVARLMMNHFLSAAGLNRSIIPTVFREDYTLSLKALSHYGDAEPYVRMLNAAAKFSALLDYGSQQHLFEQLERSQALKEPNEGRLNLRALAATGAARSLGAVDTPA